MCAGGLEAHQARVGMLFEVFPIPYFAGTLSRLTNIVVVF